MLNAFIYPSLFVIAGSASAGALLQVSDEFPVIAGHTVSGGALAVPLLMDRIQLVRKSRVDQMYAAEK